MSHELYDWWQQTVRNLKEAQAMKAPGIMKQYGSHSNAMGMGKARAGGANQGKVKTSGSKRYSAHPQKKGC